MEHLIVIADENERQLVKKYLPDCEWDIRVTGIGAINVLSSLMDIPRDTHILNVGYAGSANFELGTLVEVTEVSMNHPLCEYDEPVIKLQPIETSDTQTSMFPLFNKKAKCYTNSDFVVQSDYKDCVFDMELAFIASLGFESVSALKVVSDNLSLHTYHETIKEAE